MGGYPKRFWVPRPNISEYHSEISTRVPLCITVRQATAPMPFLCGVHTGLLPELAVRPRAQRAPRILRLVTACPPREKARSLPVLRAAKAVTVSLWAANPRVRQCASKHHVVLGVNTRRWLSPHPCYPQNGIVKSPGPGSPQAEGCWSAALVKPRRVPWRMSWPRLNIYPRAILSTSRVPYLIQQGTQSSAPKASQMGSLLTEAMISRIAATCISCAQALPLEELIVVDLDGKY